MEEANKLIGAGKKHLVMGKVVEAVGALQEACGMLAKKYGDTADECGEAFFWCGKALLDLARMENSVLGNALEGVPEEEDEEKTKDSNVDSTENVDEKTRDELRLQVYDAMAEKKDEEEKTQESVKAEGKRSEDEEESGDVEKEEAEAGDGQQKDVKKEGDMEKSGMNGKPEGEEKTEEAEKESGDKEEEEEAEDGEDEGGEDVEMECDAEEPGEGDNAAEKDSDDDEEEEEVGNLQLAWEMLELCKVIYKRKDTKEEQLMAAQAHLKLGEVSAESGNYTQALEDFQECLKLQVEHLEPDSRLLAETHYQLGLTHSLNLQYGHAIDELQSSVSVIESRLDKLRELLDKAEGPDALPEERKEMEELKALLPEIRERVEDAAEGLKMASAAAEGVKGAAAEGVKGAALDGGSSSAASTGSAVENMDPSTKSNDTPANGLGSTNGGASTAAVSNISHLVRKKRKPEESPVKESIVKKVKMDAGEANGAQEPHADDTHKANGHA